MKTGIIIFLVFFFADLNYSTGQTPLYELKLDNFVPNGDYYTANEFTFDITIRSRDSTRFEYAGGEFLINFDTIVANGGTLSFSIAGPDTSDLPPNLRPSNPRIVTDSNSTYLALDMNQFPGAGNGFIIPQNFVVKIIKLKIRTTATTFSMQGGPIGGVWYVDFGAEWRNQPPFINATNVFAYLISRNPVNISSNGWHWVNNIGLYVNPVELSSFYSNVTDNIVTLNWVTSEEINNSGFEIERSHENNQWINAGFVKGFGNTNESVSYSFSERLSTGKYSYRLKQIDYNGNFEYFELHNEVVIGLPKSASLSQNYPNPFNPSTKISYSLMQSEFVTLKIYDITGKEVRTLIEKNQDAGYHKISFNASDLSGGIYFYRIITENFTDTKRMVLLK